MIAIIKLAFTIYSLNLVYGAWDTVREPAPPHWNSSRIISLTNAVSTNKLFFVDAFMPGVDIDQITRLSYVRAGDREPPYLGVARFTDKGLVQLRNNSERDGISTWRPVGGELTEVTNNTVRHYLRSVDISNLSSRVTWWGLDETGEYEQRSVRWRGDHKAKFFISTNDPDVYIEAIIH